MDPALYEAVLHVKVDIPKHNTMYQHTSIFDAQLTQNHNPMGSNLYKAARDGDVQYLDQHTDLFDIQLTPNHNTILHVAAHFGKSDCVAKILEKKPCLISRVNSNNENPLHIAAREKHYDTVQALIGVAKELDQEPESGGGTLLELLRAINVNGDTSLHLAVRVGGAKIVSLLVGEDPDFQHLANKAEETPLYLAAEREDGYPMVNSILDLCQSPAYTGPSGRTALHAAAISGNPGSIKKLLTDWDRCEELIDKADTEGWTPLHYTAARYNQEAALLLLERDKSVGYTRTSKKDDKSTALHIAAAASNERVMEDILFYCPDCWEMVDSKGRNILHIALDVKAKAVIEYIIKTDWLDSLMNQKDFEGNTPIHLLASFDRKDIQAIINRGRLNKINFDAFNNLNWTPAEVASTASEFSWVNKPKGGRNIAKGEALKETRIRMTRYEEITKKIRAMQAEALKKTSESLMLVATLIATITFTAGFAIPGGYDGNQGLEEGMAVLVRRASFKAFIIANTIAMMCSTSSVVYYVLGAFYYKEEKKGRRYEKGFYLVLVAIVAMTVGFISGTYAMLVHSLGLAIATSIIASFTFLIYFLELNRLVYLWRRKMFPWQR